MAHLQDPSPSPDVWRIELASPFPALTRARENQALTIDEVADRLMLSRQQVRGLESDDARAFHNASFYKRARTNYEALLGLAAPAPAAPPADGLRSGDTSPLRLTLGGRGTARRPAPPVPVRLAAAALVVVALIAWGAFMLWSSTGSAIGTR